MKKIAVNTMRTFLKENKRSDDYKQTFNVGDSSFEVVFHTALSIDEKSAFINRVLSGCFDATSKFRPEYVSPMLRATIIQMCTNIPAITSKGGVGEDGTPTLDLDSMNELYLVMNLDNVQDAGYQAMLGEMVYLCNQAIEWRKGCALSGGTTENTLRNLLTAITDKVNAVDMGELLQFARDLSAATNGLNEDNILKGLLRVHDGKRE